MQFQAQENVIQFYDDETAFEPMSTPFNAKWPRADHPQAFQVAMEIVEQDCYSD